MSKTAEYKAKRRQKLLDAGQLPTCECGCGEYVNLDSRFRPTRFLRGHVTRWDNETIDVEKFREAVRSLMEKNGWSLSQTAERGGLSLNHFNGLMYDKRKTGISKELATAFLRRLAGLPEQPSSYQMRQLQGRVVIDGHKERQGLMAFDPDCYG